MVVSSLLVGIIVLGTFSAFDSAGRASADERTHAQATGLAQQDEERLRGMTVAELGVLGTATRTVTEGTTNFKITSSARYVAGESETFTCETTNGAADYLQTTSSVTWPTLGSRPPVTESGIVSGAASAGVLVKVVNQKSEPVEGATVMLNGAHPETTPASGCVIYGGLTAGTYKAEVTDNGYVDVQGNLNPPPFEKTVEVSGTALAKAEFQIARPGSIRVNFENKGTAISGDTFFALNAKIGSAAPDFVGGTIGTYVPSALLTGLFPFVAPNTYTVFAGDCEKNNPQVIASPNPEVSGKKEVVDPTAQVEPNGETVVKVEEPAVNITVYEGTKSVPGSVVTNAYAGEMDNPECASTNSQNFEPIPYEHKVSLDGGGKVVPAYQPYAKKLEFCVVSFKSPNYYRYKSPAAFPNLAKAGTTQGPFYLKEATSGYTKSTSALTC